mgnify:CR=1 FL=1
MKKKKTKCASKNKGYWCTQITAASIITSFNSMPIKYAPGELVQYKAVHKCCKFVCVLSFCISRLLILFLEIPSAYQVIQIHHIDCCHGHNFFIWPKMNCNLYRIRTLHSLSTTWHQDIMHIFLWHVKHAFFKTKKGCRQQ